ncbi:MAG: dienelactone hydrolase family protein [Acidobacteriota bacterium]|nr:dienelactone hydrolase family protein [Acidobacteriota bacterium]
MKAESEQELNLHERSLLAEMRLYYDLYLPKATPAPLLIALHGYGANKRQMMREARQMAPPGFGIASMQGFHQHMKDPKEPGGPLRFGFGWLTNFHPEESVAIHHQAVLDLIETLTAERVADPQNIFLLGFSQSCALNYRFAFTHADVLRGLIGICGGLPGDWQTNQNYKKTGAAAFHLAGNQDEFYPPGRVGDYAEQLRLRASDVKFKGYEGGHDFIPEMRGDIREWLELKVV